MAVEQIGQNPEIRRVNAKDRPQTQALCVSVGWPVFAGPMRSKSLALAGAVEYVTNPTVGAWPSGKASGFGPVIPGSNPGAPAIDFSVHRWRRLHEVWPRVASALCLGLLLA